MLRDHLHLKVQQFKNNLQSFLLNVMYVNVHVKGDTAGAARHTI